jgi:hypothetical protein
MMTLPPDLVVRVPFVVGLFMMALGLFVFVAYGAFLGSFEDRIVAWLTDRIAAHPDVPQRVSGRAATPEQAAAKAWERVKFSHGHGFSMVLAAFALLVLIAQAPHLPAVFKAALMWAGLVATSLYNVGWVLAGWLVPFVGTKKAKVFGETFFFVPLGLILVATTAIVAAVYAWHVFGVITGVR